MTDHSSTPTTTVVTQSPLQHNAPKHNTLSQSLSQQASLLSSPNMPSKAPYKNTRSFQTSTNTMGIGSQQRNEHNFAPRPQLLNFVPQQNMRNILTTMSPSTGRIY